MSGNIRSIGTDAGWTIVILGASGWVVFLDDGDQVNECCPGRHVQDAIVVGVQVVTICASKAADEQVGHVVAVLKVEAGGQIGCAQAEGALGGHKVAAAGNGVAAQVNHGLDDAAAARAIADDQVGQAIQRRACRTDQLKVLVIVVAGLINAYLADDYVGNRTAAKGLAVVDGANGVGAGAGPHKVLVKAALARQLQGISNGCIGRFSHANVGAGHPIGWTADSHKSAFVAEELHHAAAGVHQGYAVW